MMLAAQVPDVVVGVILTFVSVMLATSIVGVVKLAMIVTRLESRMESNDKRLQALEDHRIHTEYNNENR